MRSNFERTVAAALHERGFEEFLPISRVRRQWSDRVKEMERPLFPGYVLARFDAARLWPVLAVPGVVHVVSYGKTPAPIDDGEIAAIQAVVESGLPAEPWPHLTAGDRVVIERGPLGGHEGLLLQIRNRCRLVVSISIMQRSVAVEIDRGWVRPGSDGAGSFRSAA